jgi:D-alanyl-lipoteichoic acid acyltransferase DltB (MBOAT superfamily)
MNKVNGKWRKLCLAFGIVGMISILTVFKYLNFFTGNANRLLNLIGIQKSFRLYDIVLPVGISFFPQLVAGPIERSKNLLFQLKNSHRIRADWELYGGVELLTAAIGFSIQIYCDFAGYSAIAIGAAESLHTIWRAVLRRSGFRTIISRRH